MPIPFRGLSEHQRTLGSLCWKKAALSDLCSCWVNKQTCISVFVVLFFRNHRWFCSLTPYQITKETGASFLCCPSKSPRAVINQRCQGYKCRQNIQHPLSYFSWHFWRLISGFEVRLLATLEGYELQRSHYRHNNLDRLPHIIMNAFVMCL